MQASKSTTSKKNNKGLEILIIEPATRSTNLIEVTKQLDYYVQQNYKTLFDCIKTSKLREINPPQRPTHQHQPVSQPQPQSSFIHDPAFILLLQALNPEAAARLQQTQTTPTQPQQTTTSRVQTRSMTQRPQQSAPSEDQQHTEDENEEEQEEQLQELH
jgi:hypothetical protein